MLRRHRRRGDPGEKSSADALYRDLRAMALGAVSKGLPSPRADHLDVSGAVIDVPEDGGYATLVSLTDDTTSMYTSTGGGMIGAGGHAAVASATHELLAAIDRQLAQFTVGEDTAMPPPGIVRFHVLAPGGGLTSDVPAASFWGKSDHPLMPVIAAAQQVLSAMRTVSPE